MRRLTFAVVLLFSLLIPSAMFADVVFNFDSTPTGTHTPFSLTQSGLTASFGGSGVFAVIDTTGFGFTNLSGNALFQVDTGNLDISFNGTLPGMHFDFAMPNLSDTLTVQAYLNGVAVGAPVNITNLTADSGGFGEGLYSFQGSVNEVQISGNDLFAVDNVTAVPEPASLLLLGSGLVGLAGRKLRRQE